MAHSPENSRAGAAGRAGPGAWFVLVESNTTGSGRLFCSAAAGLGLRPVMIARDPARYPYVAADGIDVRVADTADPAAVVAACRALGGEIAGVTSSSEYFIATAARVAACLEGLSHPDPDAVLACRDKHTQRIVLAKAGLPGPAFGTAATPDQAAAAAARIGFPVVVKPVSGTGSIAVRRCDTPAQVRAAAGYAFASPDPALPPQRAVLVEQYLAGAEYSAELIDDHVVGITRKLLGPEPHFVETGHDFPAPLDPARTAALSQAAVDAVRALGLGWGGAHVELRLDAGPVVIEVNPRLAGGMIPRAVQEATGIDMIFHVVAAAAGRPVPPEPRWHQAAAIRFLLVREAGTLAEVTGLDAARQVPGVAEAGVTAQPGQQVRPRNSFRDRVGYVIGSGPDHHHAARAACAGLDCLAVWLN